jgi:hypothetical protein
VDAAKRLWAQALGAGDPRLATLASVTVSVGDLPAGTLAQTIDGAIIIDRYAAGWGWFADPTPFDNSEFAVSQGDGVFAATPASPAYGHMDLLTTVLHELGNAMGFAEDQGQDVTGMTLSAGVRRVFAAAPQSAASDGTAAATAVAVLSGDGPSANAPADQPNRSAVSAGSGLPYGEAIGWQGYAGVSVAPAAAPPGLAAAATDPAQGATKEKAGAAPLATNALLAGSFVVVNPATGISLDPFAAPAPTSGPPSADPGAPAGGDQHHSSTPLKQPTINWDAGADKSLGQFDSAADDSPDWLDDFLNHLGQDQSVWNPNAGIRIQLTNSPATNLV